MDDFSTLYILGRIQSLKYLSCHGTIFLKFNFCGENSFHEMDNVNIIFGIIDKTDWVFSRLHQVWCQEWTGTGSDRATEHQRVHLGLRQAEDVPIRGTPRVEVEIE